MTFLPPPPPRRTHEVLNQAPPLEGWDLFGEDLVLREALRAASAGWAEPALHDFGTKLGGAPLEWGATANAQPPRLLTHDRSGNRLDAVEYVPAYHQLMSLGVAAGVHALAWREPRPGGHPTHAALLYLLSQVEAGVGCPLSMTYSVIPALRALPSVSQAWEPSFTSLEYDPRLEPASRKRGALCGMAMTEKQGGSDVRANRTRAEAIGPRGTGAQYALTGHKWFCSAPMSDAFLVLAQAEGGLSCFFLPRFLPDDSKNRIHLQRLKDKLGNRANASAEIELDGAWAVMVGEEGRGVATILEMVNHTRLDCVAGSAACMRQALTQALHHATHRSAFGRRLVEQPLMQNVLADLALEVEAAVWLLARLAQAYDARDDANQRRFARLATAVGKFWVCKRAPIAVAEALECLGGNGYVEESGLPRLFRDSPLNSIWEGSGNVICLDALRTVQSEPGSLELFFAEVDAAQGRDARLDRFVAALKADLARSKDREVQARGLVERLALALQASLLLQNAPAFVADAFLASRLGERSGRVFGTLPAGLPLSALLTRAWSRSG